MRRLMVGIAVIALCALVMTPRGAADQPPGTRHSSRVGAPRADVLQSGNVVVSLAVGGDLSGSLTLTLTPNGNGGYTGDWGFTVAHADNTDPDTGEDPEWAEHEEGHEEGGEGEEHPHKAFLRLVHRGSLAGSVDEASVTIDGDGKLTGLAAGLTLGQGAAEFDGAAGSGTVTLNDLTLNF